MTKLPFHCQLSNLNPSYRKVINHQYHEFPSQQQASLYSYVPGLQFPSKDVIAQCTLLETFQNKLRSEPCPSEVYLSYVPFKVANDV